MDDMDGYWRRLMAGKHNLKSAGSHLLLGLISKQPGNALPRHCSGNRYLGRVDEEARWRSYDPASTRNGKGPLPKRVLVARSLQLRKRKLSALSYRTELVARTI
jgi:hypothetical protein